jgi:hypothetical protein
MSWNCHLMVPAEISNDSLWRKPVPASADTLIVPIEMGRKTKVSREQYQNPLQVAADHNTEASTKIVSERRG